MKARSSLYLLGGKRAFDLVVSIPAVVLLSPVLAAIAIAIKRDMGSPVLYRQRRPGKDGVPFTILKFRTMLPAVDEAGGSLADDSQEAYQAARTGARSTNLGELLRRTSLDELPELFNVIQGSMSVVGPRPLLLEYLERYTPEQARRHEVRPGLTGWAQVNGRQALEYESRFEHDVWYVDNVTFGLDLKIIWMTLAEVVRGRGVSELGYTTGTEFRGEDAADAREGP